MSRIIKLILAANLIALTVLVFAFPQFMIAPGKSLPGHKAIETDCFACHVSFRGTASERCTACHEPTEIGILTTQGKPVAKPNAVGFHQKLAASDCASCHSEHAGSRRFRQQGRFNHTLLDTALRDDCRSCHKAPDTALHRRIDGQCSQCHAQEKWKPATFDHDKFFVLDRDHDTECSTCHRANDYTRYTCYGCHEHSPARIRGEHAEEGIRDFDNCVECHRSADEHDIRGRGEGRGGEGGEHSRRGRREHDD